MALKLKYKIAWGGIFLFLLLTTVGIVSYYFLNRISAETRNIIRDNYESLNYGRQLLLELDKVRLDSAKAFGEITDVFAQQANNITEPGELQASLTLQTMIDRYRSQGAPDSLEPGVRNQIDKILKINLDAIDKKNQQARTVSEDAKTIISIIITACLLLGISFIYNFPSLVSSPIVSLTEGIKAVTEKKYGERIHLNRNDEFGELARAFNQMAERLDEYEHSNLAQILFEKRRAETVIHSLKDASIGIDEKGIILFANQQALQLLDLRENEIVGEKTDKVSSRNDLFKFILQKDPPLPFKIVVHGKENFFTREIVDIHPEGINPVQVFILRNITSFKELDSAKTLFMATISHELKTPLASSDFSLKLLGDERTGPLNQEQKELIQSLKEDNRRILRILSELLDLTQVETGRIELNISRLSPYELVENARLSVQNAAREKNITLQSNLARELPLLKADPEKAGWILNNFLTNAVKFSPENGQLVIEAKRSGNWVEIGVRDEGTGIEEAYLNRVFDRYFKIPGQPAAKGTGLGLAISKDLTEAMGGQIGAESQIGKGSYFYFRLLVDETA